MRLIELVSLMTIGSLGYIIGRMIEFGVEACSK